MPLVRIDLDRAAPPERARIVGQAVYDAMTAIANVPANDRFQIVTRHDADELVVPAEGYLGLHYTRDIVFIQVTWVAGRSTEVKQRFFRQVADEIHAKAGVRREDVFISLVPVAREDWSFGNGDMQYAPT